MIFFVPSINFNRTIKRSLNANEIQQQQNTFVQIIHTELFPHVLNSKASNKSTPNNSAIAKLSIFVENCSTICRKVNWQL